MHHDRCCAHHRRFGFQRWRGNPGGPQETFAAFAVFGTSAITAITAQNTRGVRALPTLIPPLSLRKSDAVADDFTIAAAKTGMLS